MRLRGSLFLKLAAYALGGYLAERFAGPVRRPEEAAPTLPELRFASPSPIAGIVVTAGLAAAALAYGGWAVLDRESRTRAVAIALTGGDPGRAPSAIRRYGCGGCHTIPGVPGADGRVAASLGGLRERTYIGGVLENDADNLVAWMVDPPRFSPRTAMPRTGVSQAEARDIAAYLYTR